MIDDTAEGVAKRIIRTVLEFLFRLVEFIPFYSGEIIIFFLTSGRRRPRWDYYATEYIEIFYNRQRTEKGLGYLSPAAYANNFYAGQLAA